MLLWFLLFLFVVAPALAAWDKRRRDQKAERLIQEVRLELAARKRSDTEDSAKGDPHAP